MKWKIAVSLVALGLLLLLSQSWESQASNPPPCHTCQSVCEKQCGVQQSTCQFAGPVCFNGDCGPGGCSYICANGQTGSFSCNCDTCETPPGGSPIFRKQETARPAGDQAFSSSGS